MSTVVSTCTCGDVSENVITFCKEHHIYRRGLKELASVTRVLKSTWPIPPDFSKADPAVLESARERGVELDVLFTAYVNGTLNFIPAGTRSDVVELFDKLQKWWDRQGVKAQAQVILADSEIAGTCDILTHDGAIFDLKATYDIEATYPIQVGFYAVLHEAMYGKVPESLGIIHCTKRYPEPKLINVPVATAYDDAEVVRAMWKMVQRRKPQKPFREQDLESA